MRSKRSMVREDQRNRRALRDRRAAPSRRRKLAAAFQALEPRYLLAFSSSLFADINQFGVSSVPDSFIEFDNQVFFVANDALTGSELWKSDGTASGTVRVTDINPGPGGSLPADLTVLGADLFFTAIDDNDEADLWKTDGTTAGTVRVFDADTAGAYYLRNLTASGTRLFFTAYEPGVSGDELWAHDGTSTALVKDINPDQNIIDGPQELTDVNGTLFFTSYSNGYDNRELWKSNGTLAGTMLVSDVDGDNTTSSDPRDLINLNGTLFFVAEGASDGVELFKSTPSTGTTVQVADVNPGSESSYPESLTDFNGQLFFTAEDGVTGRQLMKSDGTSATLVANTTPGGTGSSNPTELTVVGSELYFVSSGGVVPGPVAATAPALTTINSLRNNSADYAGLVVTTSNARQGLLAHASSPSVSFSTPTQGASNSGPGWISPGDLFIGGINGNGAVGLSNIAVGDIVFRDLPTSSQEPDNVYEYDWTISDPAGLSNIEFSGFASGNEFSGAGEAIRFELFLNGSSTRTDFMQLLESDDLNNWFAGRDADNLSLSDPGGASITSATVRMTFQPDGGNERIPFGSNEALVINAALTATGGSSGTAGREVHKTDGTTTNLVKDIVANGSSNPSELTGVNGKLFFSANDPTLSGRELWTSDGTEAGTVLVKDIRSGFDGYGAPLSGDPQNLQALGNQLLFSVTDDLNDREMWTTDGTETNTQLVKNIDIGTQDANIQQIVQVGTKLFFVADDGIRGEAVWVADPSAGTVEVAADVTGSASDRVSGLAKFGSGVIFHNDSLGVYTTDGTTTTPITAMQPVEFDSKGNMFVEAGGLAFFVANDGNSGEELWKTDGTSAGTAMVFDLNLNPNTGSDPRYLVEFQNKVFFAATESSYEYSYGREVFSSDGTGTMLLRDVNTTPLGEGNANGNSDPADLTVSGGRLFFAAGDTQNSNVLRRNRELWSSDGTTGGTSMTRDIKTGTNNNSDPNNLTDVGGVLYFSADNGSDGFEPYKSDGTLAGTTQVANVNPNFDSNPSGFLQAGSTVYFSASETATGTELWQTNGTPAGTSLVSDLQSGINSGNPLPLGEIGSGRVIVAATGSGTADEEFWIAGSTLSGLQLALDMNPGPFFGSEPTELIPMGSDLFFVGDDGLSGRELYRLEEFAPEVESVVIDDGTQQRSTIETFTVTFNSVVEINGDAFEFRDLTSNEIAVDVASVSEVNGKTVVDFTFVEGAVVNAAGLLQDGDYQFTVEAVVVESFGTQLDGNGDGTSGDDYVFGAQAADEFYRKFGDNNGNNVVDLLDFAEFRRSFGSKEGDSNWNRVFDNDGLNDEIDLLDFAEFRRNFGT